MDGTFQRIRELAKRYEPDMTRFLRDMIALPSESCGEREVVERIRREMEKVVRPSGRGGPRAG